MALAILTSEGSVTDEMIEAALDRAVLSDSARAASQAPEEWLRLVEDVALEAATADGLTVQEIHDRLRLIFAPG